jgi:ATP-dependent helicase HrpB
MTMQLPVHDILPQLLDSLLVAGRNAVLVAPPGAGKTTTVPLALMESGAGKILLLEPRRLAARAAAMRMSALLGEKTGTRVGFRTRLESAVSPDTVIEVITEGLLTSRLLSDPGLTGIQIVIFDEIHERSLESDLALALTLDLQRTLRPELRILAMSATAEAAKLATLLDADIIESDGRMFPVTTHHTKRDIPTVRELPAAAAQAVREALVAHQGDILVFLPGMAEIRRTQSALEGCPALVLPLHGDLSPEAQDLALREHDKRRVVLSTSIAETSLTVPGVRIVIDGGFRRAPKLDVSPASPASPPCASAAPPPRSAAAAPAAKAQVSPSVSGPKPCIAASPRSRPRRFSTPNSPAWNSLAPPGAIPAATCPLSTHHRKVPSKPPALCSPISARWTIPAASPNPAAKWPACAPPPASPP